MDHLDHPSFELWEERRQWFEEVEERRRGIGAYFVSEQACALSADVQAAYCAGAWSAVVVLALAVVDASLRETEVPGFRGDTKKLLQAAEANPELQVLRRRRNALVHINPESPAITVDDQWLKRAAMEEEAKRAVDLMFEAMYIGPWT